jgi:hypothetical protein
VVVITRFLAGADIRLATASEIAAVLGITFKKS